MSEGTEQLTQRQIRKLGGEFKIVAVQGCWSCILTSGTWDEVGNMSESGWNHVPNGADLQRIIPESSRLYIRGKAAEAGEGLLKVSVVFQLEE